MAKTFFKYSQQLYSQVIRLYPRKYQAEFGQEMEYVFSELMIEAIKEKGKKGVGYIWATTLIDALQSIIMQHLESTQGKKDMPQTRSGLTSKSIIKVALLTLVILILPLLGNMLMSDDFNWQLSDFVISGLLLFLVGIAIEFIRNKIQSKKRAILIALLILGFGLWLYIELAVGLFTQWGS